VTLRADVERFLDDRGPSTSTAIALGVHARRRDVDVVLASDRFERVPPPVGCSPRGVYFGLSRLVPGHVRGVSRAVVMLGILSDGEPHTRSELLAALVTAGVSIYVNNGAAELRAAGYDVRFSRRGGGCYWIESPNASGEVAA
jgi:hypothetical protein